MNTMPMMTADDKEDLIALYKLTSMLAPGSAAQALVDSLGKFLRDGSCTPDDAADILKGVFDERVDQELSQMKEPTPGAGLMDFLSMMDE